MEMSNIYPLLQSAYRKHHSTEMALLKVMNDILLKSNSPHVTLLVMLDLHVSAAFDTLNHNEILFERLQHDFGISEYPSNGSSHTCQTEVKESNFKEHYLRILILNLASQGFLPRSTALHHLRSKVV